MAKSIAVLVRDRQAEALRVAIGLSLEDDKVQVYMMDCKLDANDPVIAANIEMLNDLGTRIVSNRTDNPFEAIDNETIACELVYYDTVIPY